MPDSVQPTAMTLKIPLRRKLSLVWSYAKERLQHLLLCFGRSLDCLMPRLQKVIERLSRSTDWNRPYGQMNVHACSRKREKIP